MMNGTDGTDMTKRTIMNIMNNMNNMNSTTSPTSSTGSPELERRISRLERSNRVLTLILTGALGIGAGAVMVAAQQAVPPVKQAPSCKPVSIVLDPSRSSGRWSSTLLAVDADGIVYSLDTSRPQPVWGRFQFSP